MNTNVSVTTCNQCVTSENDSSNQCNQCNQFRRKIHICTHVHTRRKKVASCGVYIVKSGYTGYIGYKTPTAIEMILKNLVTHWLQTQKSGYKPKITVI